MSIISPKLLGLFILSALTPLLSYSASASETKEWPASMASGTLPVIYIDTENNTPIIDKETKIPADLFMTVPPQCAFEALGTSEEPVKLEIKGRGNSSWSNSPKKPYKLKFEKKTAIAGMPKNKHYALLSCHLGYIEWISYMAGLELSRMAGNAWTPTMEPVELVLNGSYEGLYFLTETIKIDKNRVDIFEQEDLCEDPGLIAGGWLVEIDNYDNPAQIVIEEFPGQDLRITYHTPEELSEIQHRWLIDEFTTLNTAIYANDDSHNSWTDYIDAASVARYFIVREILHDTDGYNGSFYLHKDLAPGSKWIFGPMWDLASDIKKDWIMNDHPDYSQVHWIEALSKTDAFKAAVSQLWEAMYDKLDGIYDYIDEIAAKCAKADLANEKRWEREGDTYSKAGAQKDILKHNISWIKNHIYDLSGIDRITNGISEQPIRIYGNSIEFGMDIVSYTITDISGKTCMAGSDSTIIDISALNTGLYILRCVDKSGNSYSKKIINARKCAL